MEKKRNLKNFSSLISSDKSQKPHLNEIIFRWLNCSITWGACLVLSLHDCGQDCHELCLSFPTATLAHTQAHTHRHAMHTHTHTHKHVPMHEFSHTGIYCICTHRQMHIRTYTNYHIFTWYAHAHFQTHHMYTQTCKHAYECSLFLS